METIIRGDTVAIEPDPVIGDDNVALNLSDLASIRCHARPTFDSDQFWAGFVEILANPQLMRITFSKVQSAQFPVGTIIVAVELTRGDGSEWTPKTHIFRFRVLGDPVR